MRTDLYQLRSSNILVISQELSEVKVGHILEDEAKWVFWRRIYANEAYDVLVAAVEVAIC